MKKTLLVLLVLLAAATSAQAADYTGIESLDASCSVEGAACELVSDTSAGTCRTVEWTSAHGTISIQGCEKDAEVEVYRKEYPSDTSFSACLGDGCMDEYRGWTSFTPSSEEDSTSNDSTTDSSTDSTADDSTNDSSSEQTTDETTQDETTQLSGLDANYETMIQAWQDREIDRVTVDGKQMIVAPWFVNDAGSYHTSCGAAGTSNDYCVVTDEDSQYTLAVAMSRDQELVNDQARPLFNKIKHLATTGYGANTRWRFRVTDGDIKLGTDDFASDADARYLLALYNLANNPALTDEGLKQEIRSYAQGYCADYKEHAFVKDDVDGVTYWPAGGGNVGRVGSVAESSNWWSVTYPGYYGDMSLAMLACGANTGDQEYFAVADDALKAYFEIADYDGSSLRLAHGRAGVWTLENGDVGYECQSGCPSHQGTENADGVRFTSICTVDHFADELGLGFTPLADRFCEDISSSEGYEDTAYAVQWTGDGQPASVVNSGWQANGLPLYIDIEQSAYADDRVESIWNQWTGESFNDQQLFDVFWGGFLVNGLGFNLERADAAFSLDASNVTYTPDTGGDSGDDSQSNQTSGSDDQSTDSDQTDNTSEQHDSADQPLIMSLQETCSIDGESCEQVSDVYDGGGCRELSYASGLRVKGCQKSDGDVELYVLDAPQASFEFCLGAGCVSQNSGYARFNPQEPDQPSIDPVEQLGLDPVAAGDLLSDESDGECRVVTYENVSVRICPN